MATGISPYANEKGLKVRAIAKDDFPAWKPLWDGYNAFYGRAGETALPAEVTQITWSGFIVYRKLL